MSPSLSPHPPRSLSVAANELVHHVLEWAPAGDTPGRTVVLLHGFMDAAGTWDLVAPALASAGHRVLAPDLRGFGDGARTGPGGYYHFADYVFDVGDLLDALSPGSPVSLVGHSMGGTVATLTAGSYPDRVERLACIEGLGPPDMAPEIAPVRMRAWIDGVRKVRDRGRGRGSFPRAEALRRLGLNHPGVPADVLASRLVHLVTERPEDGEDHVTWKSDPLHRTTSPVPFFASVFGAFAAQVTCPTLFVSGGARGFHPADENVRLGAFASLERVVVEDAGHMVHWTRPTELSSALVRFLR
jgi:pimeloyl-ACP methyl ester carboxylesterase